MTDEKTGNEVALAGQDRSMINIISEAMEKPDFNIDLLERLLAAQDKIKADEAKQAYIASMIEFHKDPPIIVKRKQGNNCKYAPLDDSIKLIRPALLKVNIVPTWRTKTVTLDNGKRETEVTCILSHVLGYETHSSLSGEPEDSGSKNAVQGVGSTVKYFERYTLEAACGLVAEGGDTDGVPPAPEQPFITDAEAEELKSMMTIHGVSEKEFLQATKMEKITDLLNKDYKRGEEFIIKRGEHNNAKNP